MNQSTRSRRILFLIGGFQVGGTERHLSLILPQLKRYGWDIHVRMLGDDGPFSRSLKDVEIDIDAIEANYRLKIPKIRAVQALWSQIRQVAVEIDTLNPEIIHCFLQTPSIIGWLANKLTGATRILIISKRNLMGQKGSFPGEKWLEHRALRSADFVLGHSAAVISELKGIGVSPEKLCLIHNGVDVQTYSQTMKREEVRQIEGWPPQTIIFIVIANLIPYKGHECLLQALTRMQNNGLEWKVALVGVGTQKRELFLKRLVKDIGLEEKVLFLGKRTDIPSLLSACDIGILPSIVEGFSNTILEYMAAGLPVVCTDVGGNSDAVVNGNTGILVPVDSPRMLGLAMDRLLNDAELRAKMGAAGRARVEERFSLTHCVGAYDAFYRTMLGILPP